MKLFLDTADVAAIKELNEILAVDGVSTNPTIVTRSGKEPEEVFQEIAGVLLDDQIFFAQVMATDKEGIVAEAKRMLSLKKKNMVIKIPVTKEGLKAIKECKKEGIPTLATAIYSAEQGLMAAKNGATYLAPYVNRMDNYGDGVSQVIDLLEMLTAYQMDAQIVAASFKNVSQVHRLFKAGIHSVTVPVDVARNLFEHPATTVAVGEFSAHWQKAYQRKSVFKD
ncbi:MAG: fructose-6-phosphate aldolase [Erysipelotrichaceae bacterium]|nr:fructose-6-phosphate aldolase [Erysipelotrichaceae bacterium]